MNKKYPCKSVSFDPTNESDMELFKELQKLGHGVFTKTTKDFWLNFISQEKSNNGHGGENNGTDS
ncbi:hypothetical protein [Paenibacillus sp. Soil787]|uniref:hypothetical protein n=1 Tax=Paenibacillus sp. Soil787 TaxID=1736411 RepID=UPI0006FD1BCB|nr:hypothetical protein [Paenibacillus sp. Soil787]KRF35865.1 hypothetical protein ASG93_25620 [Paenibacillus sp. Soil787]